ncbi:hypothetical protein [Flavobacterium silvaticum]|uniref:Lipoprotein n=1 Tax=Flavobacterium silvaticum TaxID=1852020 RepID=A0A972JGD9_9FLAO|nr:hypothetical protein [Flavobacterium silvaticum]NMH28949.1 hypothetical protein [Flavobacterium silvaticum]
MKYIAAFLLFSLIGCKPKMPPDFSIVGDFDVDTYNSQTGIFTRYYVMKPLAVVKMELTADEKQELFDYCEKIDFFSFPSEFQCDTLHPGGIIPSSSIEIQIRANGIIKGSRTSTYCDTKLQMEKEKKLYLLYDKLWNMIEKKAAYKSIPPADVIRL